MTDYLEGVGSGSPPDDEDTDLDQYESDEDIVDQDEGDAPDQDDGDESSDEESGKGRTIENVYRELSRKQEEFQNRMLEQQNKLIEKLAESRTAEPEKKTGNTLDDMSLQELETLRGQVAENNPDKLGEFDSYLNKRRVDDQVQSKMSDWEKRQADQQLRSRAQQDALRRYPELANRGSEFYSQVNARLNELGDSWVSRNPRAVLDAANDIAAEMGVAPRAATKVANMRGRVARKSNSNPKASAPNPKDEGGLTDKAFDQIGSRLGNAMPKGKKFDKEAIDKRAKFYRDNLQYYLRG